MENTTSGPSFPPDVSYHEADLTRSMEHLRPYVSVPASHNLPSKPPPHPTNSSPTTKLEETTYGIPSTLINPTPHPSQRPNTSNPEKRRDPTQYGSRYLEHGDDIFEFNAWDHVEADPSFTAFAQQQYAAQRAAPCAPPDRARINAHPERGWDKFYAHNRGNFFKNRNWLFHEFPSLRAATVAGGPPVTVLEVGAGAGNTAFPLLRASENEGLSVCAVDFSRRAVEVIRADEVYREYAPQGRVSVGVWDLASGEGLPEGVREGGVDIVVLVFTFSALAPEQWTQAVRNVWRCLRPGGEVLFRDYGRGDLAQVRFKKGRWLGENWYVRGDGTRVYFFDVGELRRIWGGGRMVEREDQEETGGTAGRENKETGEDKKDIRDAHATETNDTQPGFEIEQLEVDRRMLVNRQRRLKMYRCWLQGRFRKPLSSGVDKHVEEKVS